jgi:hypothetical protein
MCVCVFVFVCVCVCVCLCVHVYIYSQEEQAATARRRLGNSTRPSIPRPGLGFRVKGLVLLMCIVVVRLGIASLFHGPV